MPRYLSTFLVLLLFSCGAVAQSQDAKPPAPKKDQCRIAGTVVTLAGDEPLRKARVLLESQEDRTRSVSAGLHARGNLSIKNFCFRGGPGPLCGVCGLGGGSV